MLLYVTAVLETGGFLRHLLHSGALLPKCVVAADVVRVGLTLIANLSIRLLMHARVVILGVLHYFVNEQSTVNSLGVLHGVRSFSVTLDFMELALGDGILVQVVKVPHLIRHFQVFHIVNFSSGEHVGGLNGALAHLLVDDGLVDLVIHSVGHGALGLELVTLVTVLLSTDGSLVSPGEVHVVITDDLGPRLLEHGQQLLLILLLHFIKRLLIVSAFHLASLHSFVGRRRSVLALVGRLVLVADTHVSLHHSLRQLRLIHPLLLIGLNGNLSIDAVEILQIGRAHV